MVKGGLARDPPKYGNDAVEKVLGQLGEITKQNWIDVYRHVQCQENKYVQRAREDAEVKLMRREDKL
ncbi:hypothetical protein JG688_00018592 [Phytophthora aleatoria]|uniref:Uncharacterized protein n=1 Tax=Phytophthora aleatoria TaxID=2496075 RepID=A0A8J5MBD8_9STRA|nr:hypothetical protein JG688_00018592 [Phytophthora aleatoria]